MAREMVAMWRTAGGLVGVPGPMAHQTSDSACDQADPATSNSNGTAAGWRSWIPSLDRMPPLVQFLVRAMQWLQSKRHSAPKPAPAMRMVGQLSLGAKRHLSLVEINGVQFLIGGGVEHVTVILPVSTTGSLSAQGPQNAERPFQS